MDFGGLNNRFAEQGGIVLPEGYVDVFAHFRRMFLNFAVNRWPKGLRPNARGQLEDLMVTYASAFFCALRSSGREDLTKAFAAGAAFIARDGFKADDTWRWWL